MSPYLVHADHGRREDVGAGADHHAHPADPEHLPPPELPQPVAADHGGGQARRAVCHLRRLQPGARPPTDEDGMQADIKLMQLARRRLDLERRRRRSTRTSSNADQFQPYVRVTPRGQVNVSFFDRRLDAPAAAEPPGELLHRHVPRAVQRRRARRGTRPGSRTTRGIPRSTRRSRLRRVHRRLPGAGRGRLLRVPFVNDTHLANDPGRDPDFDRGLPRSPFQEIVTWRVPNSRSSAAKATMASTATDAAATSRTTTPGTAQTHRTYRATKQPKLSDEGDPEGADAHRPTRGRRLPQGRPLDTDRKRSDEARPGGPRFVQEGRRRRRRVRNSPRDAPECRSPVLLWSARRRRASGA